MKKVTRSIDTTVVKFVSVETDELGSPQMIEHEPQSFEGKLSEKQVRKEVAKTVDFDIIITDISIETKVYELDINLFLEHATVKQMDSEEQPEVEQEA